MDKLPTLRGWCGLVEREQVQKSTLALTHLNDLPKGQQNNFWAMDHLSVNYNMILLAVLWSKGLGATEPTVIINFTWSCPLWLTLLGCLSYRWENWDPEKWSVLSKDTWLDRQCGHTSLPVPSLALDSVGWELAEGDALAVGRKNCRILLGLMQEASLCFGEQSSLELMFLTFTRLWVYTLKVRD